MLASMRKKASEPPQSLRTTFLEKTDMSIQYLYARITSYIRRNSLLFISDVVMVLPFDGQGERNLRLCDFG